MVSVTLAAVRTVVTVAVIGALLTAYGHVDNRWYRVLAVQGESMAPTMHTGDAIVITRPPEAIQEGMVLTFQVDGAVVTHRVVAVDGDGELTVRGDANDYDDDWSSNEVRVVGIHRLTIPYVGRLLSGDVIRGSGGG